MQLRVPLGSVELQWLLDMTHVSDVSRNPATTSQPLLWGSAELVHPVSLQLGGGGADGTGGVPGEMAEVATSSSATLFCSGAARNREAALPALPSRW